MRYTSTLCAVLLMTPAVGTSQMSRPDIAQVDAGSRVRIAAPIFGPEKQVGTIVSITRDTLVLRRAANTAFLPVATSDITGLEIARGTHTRKAKGALSKARLFLWNRRRAICCGNSFISEQV